MTTVESEAVVLHVSDTHLSPDHPVNQQIWSAVVKYAEKVRPDLVIHTGDAVYDDPDNEGDYTYAAFQMRRLTSRWRILPGNHDVGDTEPDVYHGHTSTERLHRYQRHFGEGRWIVQAGGWTLIGLNSQLFDSKLTDLEVEQWNWLDKQLQDNAEDRPVGLFFHKPPFINSIDEDLFVNKSIGLQSRRRIQELVASGVVKLVGCGHLHEFVTVYSGGALMVAAPAAGMVPVGTSTWGLGLRCNGVVEYRFSGDAVRVRLLREEDLGLVVCPPAGRQPQ
jgi:3',5'-cyclic AMP phosphodiesterase CpdA